jgi:nicotinamidase-related amidase
MKTALLLIDVQQVLSTGEYAAFESKRVIDRLNHVIGLARPAGALIVVLQHEEAGGPLAVGTDGWQLDPDLAVNADDLHLRKTACDAFLRTPLHSSLQAHGITELVIGGFQSEYCVDSTTRSALALNYSVTIVADGHSTLDSPVLSAAQISAHHNETWSKLDNYGPAIHVTPADAIRFPRTSH